MRQALLAISIALAATAASTAHAESTEWVVEAKYADASRWRVPPRTSSMCA
ncbi:MAG: hypothetical protein IPK54_09980 [Dokdonella sp.]|uniref:hypothetical protein n=1 Tax=Dokdonella sp. TaxID=2291710 RepID=UPI0025C18FC2|nr:hypothetical protein [Dokdonella sp.]MBK8123861.1 hypothetical protein [Dokdonella sp.]